MSDGRQKVCPKCRAFLPRRVDKCPYCGRGVTVGIASKKRCRLCGGLEFKSVPLTEPVPGQKKIPRAMICTVCGKQV